MSLKISDRERIQILHMPHGVRGTYLLWRIGINPKHFIARETYARHRQQLADKWGIDITALPSPTTRKK
jgi:hypothetical protein